jgi:hypothetical protein
VYQWQPAQAFGWSGQTATATGYVNGTDGSASGCNPDTGGGPAISDFLYIDPSGVSHPFAGTMQMCIQAGETGGVSCYDVTNLTNVLASDGSGYTLSASWSTCPPSGNSAGILATIVSKGGTTYNPPVNAANPSPATKTDPNGNQITANSSGQFFDTLSSTTPVLTVALSRSPTRLQQEIQPSTR